MFSKKFENPDYCDLNGVLSAKQLQNDVQVVKTCLNECTYSKTKFTHGVPTSFDEQTLKPQFFSQNPRFFMREKSHIFTYFAP